MERIYPQYYDQFRCIAAACPDSCCKEWEVDVDDSAAAYYRALPGALGDRLRQVLRDTEDGTVMTIEDGRCPMWRSDGLCRIQAELGHDALCQTCRDFPRLRHDYGDFIEQDLELSCPEAARLILCASDAAICQTIPGGEAPDYDTEAMAILRRTRAAYLAYLDTSPALPHALAVLLLYGHAVQSELDGAEPATLEPEATLQQAKKFAKIGNMADIFHFFSQLEILTPQWQKLLTAGPAPQHWAPGMEKILRYLIRRYWLQAVSDYDLLCRVKFIITACLLLSAIPGELSATAQLFSKEIENDPDNVEAILDGAYRSAALTDLQLLSLLLSESQ